MKTLNYILPASLFFTQTAFSQGLVEAEEKTFWEQSFMGFHIIELIICFVAIVGVVILAYTMSKSKKKSKATK